MTQSEAHTAAHRINGYLITRPGERTDATFERAKQEAVFHLRQDLENVENMSKKQFIATMKEIYDASLVLDALKLTK